MKKLVNLLLLSLTICLITCCFAFNVGAVPINEQEDNNSYATANRVDSGDSINGNLQNYSDKDFFEFVVPADGILSFDFCHTYQDSLSNWRVSLIKYDNGEYKEVCEHSISLSNSERITFPDMGVVCNNKYYIEVASRSYGSITGVNYTINVSFAESDSFEKEYNDEYSTANIINSGNSIRGNLQNNSDKDFFKIVANTDGKLSFDFCHTYQDSLSNWRVSLIKYDNGEYQKVYEYGIELNDNERITFPDVWPSAGSTYYIEVASRSYGSITGVNYTINVSSRKWVTNEEGQWMYLKDGVPQTGWVLDSTQWYYMNSDGIMQTGWIYDSSNWYYLSSNGAMQTGWVFDGSAWYYMNDSGAMQTGWIKVDRKWYYLNDSGAMQTGWIQLDAWYYLGSDGAMYQNCVTPDGYYVDRNGRWIR